MYTPKHALAVASLAIPPLLLAIYFVHRDVTAPPPEQTPGFHMYGGRTEGDGRLDALRQITRLYVKQDHDVTAGMKQGTDLAPVPFLNEELEHRGLKWRVRQAHGLITETYDVL